MPIRPITLTVGLLLLAMSAGCQCCSRSSLFPRLQYPLLAQPILNGPILNRPVLFPNTGSAAPLAYPQAPMNYPPMMATPTYGGFGYSQGPDLGYGSPIATTGPGCSTCGSSPLDYPAYGAPTGHMAEAHPGYGYPTSPSMPIVPSGGTMMPSGSQLLAPPTIQPPLQNPPMVEQVPNPPKTMQK